MIIHEQFNQQWFAIPKDLLLEYSERIGTVGIALYAYLAAHADESFSCILPDVKLTDALVITTFELREILQVLKDTRLVKCEAVDAHETLYTLLWQPSQVS